MKRLLSTIIALFLFGSSYNSNAQTEVTFYTTNGDFIVMLYDSLMPITAGNFKSLVDSNFYDGVIFHRVIDNFVIQGGDPTGTGFGGPGYTIPDEFDSTLSNIQRTISMANSGPNTGGSQFFINLVNNTFLDFDKAPLTSKHPVFGIVVYNWPVARNIGRVPVNSSDKPITDVVMDSLRVTPADLSVVNHFLHNKIHIYPNPATEKSSIYFRSLTGGEAIISVYSISGQKILEEKIVLRAGNNSYSLKPMFKKDLPSGRYTVVIDSNQGRLTESLMIK